MVSDVCGYIWNREKEFPYFIEVNSTPGLIGIESTFSKSTIPSDLYKDALKSQKGKFSITSEILKKYMNRDNWTWHLTTKVV